MPEFTVAQGMPPPLFPGIEARGVIQHDRSGELICQFSDPTVSGQARVPVQPLIGGDNLAFRSQRAVDHNGEIRKFEES